jgi:crotonobetainyl-CoA:carnitine CoA-transferase CaiB-like acyl-CoA transferase
MLAADDDDAFVRLCHIVDRDDLATDPRFETARHREQHRIELEDLLAPVFLTRTAHMWESESLVAGVGCVVADAMSHFAFLYKDPQALAIGMMTPVSHPAFGGTYWRYAPVLRFSDTPSRALPFCDFGEHTRTILAEFGYGAAEIDHLRDDGVVEWQAQTVASTH